MNLHCKSSTTLGWGSGIRAFLISSIFISNARLKLAKNQANAKQHLRLNFYYLKIIHILHPCYHPKIIEHILKIKQKSKCVCFHEIMRLIIMKMEMKMKNGSHRHETNKIRSRDNECLIMMMFICIKQHLSNI